ncbi:unnamed protein product [Lactuca saligna]|uniref:Uncharacterized protein n=1 Tax=Lactuca saligna TaxID=75948 RepID=A0AA35ZDG6_LACSI|nr:unnamed protein product [Lactuca saligna]
MMEELGCVEEGKVMYYHFKRPLGDLDFGLFALDSDQDFNHLRSYVASHKLTEVYTKFWRTNLHTYAMSPNPSKLRIEEIVEPPYCSRRLCLEWIDTTTVEPPVLGPSMQTPTMEPNMESPSHIDIAHVNLVIVRVGESSDSDDSDFIVDEDNLLDDSEVDMHDFYLNIDDNLEWIGDAPITTENVVMSDGEMEVINTDVLQSESSSD